mgnify:FL=1
MSAATQGRDLKPIALIAVLAAVVGGGAWWMFGRASAPTNAPPKAVTATEAPVEKAAPAVNLPPLEQMDAFLRPLLQALTVRPEMVRWLATDDLIGQLAAAIDRAANGQSAARDLRAIRPSGAFVAAGRGDRRTIDPRSYARYDSLVMTVTSIDASKAAQLYKTIRPRLNEAYRRLGHPDGDVDRATRQAIDVLLQTPSVKDPIALVPAGGVGWAYADHRLEDLDAAQRQLLRMGPAHVEALQTWLHAFRGAI